ncbi:MAG TPA: hypothetical protein DCF49_07310 [Lachnospiraceae bacterium]|nr:hypothetical protein [Lachnospiraceae bacterium]
MFLISGIQNIVEMGAQQLLTWVTELLPKLFLFLILLNAVTAMIGRSRVERLAAKCGANPLLRYLVLPFLSAVVLGNPMAISMGRYLPERYKPAYFASASYHCHTNSGIFQHINPAELFLWLGIANGVLALGLDPFPLAVRYLAAGLVANFISGYATELITGQVARKQGIRLDRKVDLWMEREGEEEAASAGAVAASAAQEGASAGPAKETDSAATPSSEAGEIGERVGSRSGYRTIRITRGDGGYGGPLIVTPTAERHKVLYMTAGDREPEPLARIAALSGMEPVNGNRETCPDEEVALAIIDCGGTLRCGIYPGKGIPTVNLLATGKSGPLAKYMTEDLYVSAVTSACVSSAEEAEASGASAGTSEARAWASGARAEASGVSAEEPAQGEERAAPESQAGPEEARSPVNGVLGPVLAVSKVISLFQQSARDAVRTCLEMILPFMGFAALFIGICKGSGLTAFLARLMEPMGGSLPGLISLGILCSVPGLSAILGAGAVSAQMFSTVIGELIATGSMPPYMALPALFAINCQCACDFIPVGLGMTEARPETTQAGIAAVTVSRFATGWIRILVAVVFSIGLYR